MRISAEAGGAIQESAAECIVVFHFEGEPLGHMLSTLNSALDGTIETFLDRKEFKGTVGDLVSIHTLGRLKARRLIVAGLGKRMDKLEAKP